MYGYSANYVTSQQSTPYPTGDMSDIENGYLLIFAIMNVTNETVKNIQLNYTLTFKQTGMFDIAINLVKLFNLTIDKKNQITENKHNDEIQQHWNGITIYALIGYNKSLIISNNVVRSNTIINSNLFDGNNYNDKLIGNKLYFVNFTRSHNNHPNNGNSQFTSHA